MKKAAAAFAFLCLAALLALAAHYAVLALRSADQRAQGIEAALRQMKRQQQYTEQRIGELRQELSRTQRTRPELRPPADQSYDKLRQRQENEARATLCFPELTGIDLKLLSDSEIDTQDAVLSARDKTFPARPSAAYAKAGQSVQAKDFSRYLDAAGKPVPVDPGQKAPEIRVRAEGTQGLYPRISLGKVTPPAGRLALYYCEFDTDPSFSGPNFWRYPALVPLSTATDLTSRAGLSYSLFQTIQRDADGTQREIVFPFRATAMRIPAPRAALDYGELCRHAQALGWGLSAEKNMEEVFFYVRQGYCWATDTKLRYPLDTFRAGLGGCGSIDNLAGALLELNGIRYRSVGGFDPSYRVIYPGGGHTAIEVLVPELKSWSYFDPYMDILAPGVPVQDFARHREIHDLPIFPVGSNFFNGFFEKEVSLGMLFRYHRYYDYLSRLPFTSMLKLCGREHDYGLQWSLNRAQEESFARLFPEEIEIHVRARAVFTKGRKVAAVYQAHTPASPGTDIIATPWSTASFRIRPAELLDAAASKAAAKNKK